MPGDTSSRNIYKFTLSPQPNSNMRFSFTPVSAGEITIDITIGPAVNASNPSSNQIPASPPQYPSTLLAAPTVAAPPYASTSLSQNPSLPPGVRPFDLMPTQLQRDFLEDFAQFCKTVPETDDESEILLWWYNQLDKYAISRQKKLKRKSKEGNEGPSKRSRA